MTRKKIMPYLYDAVSFKQNIDRTKKFTGDAGILLPRELEYLVPKIEKQVTPTQTYLTLGINIDNSGGWADTITKRKRKVIGGFKRNDGNGANTDGVISIGGEYDSLAVFGYKAKSEFDETNLQQAKLSGTNIITDLIMGHNTKYLEAIDTICYAGDGSKTGLLNYANFTRHDSTATLSNISDEELYKDIKDLLVAQNSDAGNELFYANKLVTSVAVKRRCDSSDYKANTDLSITQKIKKDFGVDIVATFNAKGIGAGGTDVAVAICTATEAVNTRIPVKLRITPISQMNGEYSFSGIFRLGGVDISEDVGHVLEGL